METKFESIVGNDLFENFKECEVLEMNEFVGGAETVTSTGSGSVQMGSFTWKCKEWLVDDRLVYTDLHDPVY